MEAEHSWFLPLRDVYKHVVLLLCDTCSLSKVCVVGGTPKEACMHVPSKLGMGGPQFQKTDTCLPREGLLHTSSSQTIPVYAACSRMQVSQGEQLVQADWTCAICKCPVTSPTPDHTLAQSSLAP